ALARGGVGGAAEVDGVPLAPLALELRPSEGAAEVGREGVNVEVGQQLAVGDLAQQTAVGEGQQNAGGATLLLPALTGLAGGGSLGHGLPPGNFRGWLRA